MLISSSINEPGCSAGNAEHCHSRCLEFYGLKGICAEINSREFNIVQFRGLCESCQQYWKFNNDLKQENPWEFVPRGKISNSTGFTRRSMTYSIESLKTIWKCQCSTEKFVLVGKGENGARVFMREPFFVRANSWKALGAFNMLLIVSETEKLP